MDIGLNTQAGGLAMNVLEQSWEAARFRRGLSPKQARGRVLEQQSFTQFVWDFLEAECGPYLVVNPDMGGKVPETLTELREAVRSLDGEIPVSGEACSNTVFVHSDRNCQFRALHDRLHLATGFDTTAAGEMALAVAHQAQLDAALGHCRASDSANEAWLRAVIWAETFGQNAHYVAHGKFPRDQALFTLRAIAYGVDAAVYWAE